MTEIFELVVFLAALCGPAEECYVIPDPTDQTARSYIVEVCQRDVEPYEISFFSSGGEVYRIKANVKPVELCSSNSRPPDGLEQLNRLP